LRHFSNKRFVFFVTRNNAGETVLDRRIDRIFHCSECNQSYIQISVSSIFSSQQQQNNIPQSNYGGGTNDGDLLNIGQQPGYGGGTNRGFEPNYNLRPSNNGGSIQLPRYLSGAPSSHNSFLRVLYCTLLSVLLALVA
jgi:hypothetical protein